MRRWLAALLGLYSLAAGVLLIRRDDENALRPMQIAVNEFSLFAALAGIVALLMSRSRGIALAGGVGALLSLKPLSEQPAAAEDARISMQAGLGRDYLTTIPASVKKRLLPTTWSAANATGAFLRQARARIWRDVLYASPDGIPLKLDVYQPFIAPAIGSTYPAIIAIHPGGWRNQDKGGWFEAQHRYLASQGYVVFDIQHRLSGQARWPAQLEDVQAAIQWVRDSAASYRVDVKRIALLGRSSGAQLALIAGLRTEQTKPVQAIISIYGLTDLKFESLPPESPIYQLMGGAYETLPEAYREASPVDWVQPDSPPILVIEGMQDTLVPYLHGDKLIKRLMADAVPHALVRIPWARHGFDAAAFGLGAQLAQYHMDRFLAYVFYGKG